jgi:hypothetical protein
VLPFSECGHVLRMKRMPAKPPKASALAPALVGHYRCVDLDTDARISLSAEKLAMHFQGGYGNLHLNLEPLSEVVMLATEPMMPAAMPKLSMVLVREGGAVMGFRLNGLRGRDLWFARLGVAGAD